MWFWTLTINASELDPLHHRCQLPTPQTLGAQIYCLFIKGLQHKCWKFVGHQVLQPANNAENMNVVVTELES